MKKLIGLAVLGIFMVGGACLAAEIDPIKICDKQGCYGEDALGGYGVKPQRTFKLEYDGSPVCKVIQTALNDAIKNPEEAEKRITHPVPVRMDLITKEKAEEVEKAPPTYRSQNPLFSDPIFLQWNILAGDPAWNLYQYNWGYNSRWIIVPYKNDNKKFLITTSPGGIYQEGPPTNPEVWNILPDQLNNSDWSVPNSYKDKKGYGNEIYLRKFAYLNPSPSPGSRLFQFYNNVLIKDPWRYFVLGAYVFWANINNELYTLYFDEFDRVEVVDIKANSIDNLCYMDSEFTKKIYGEANYETNHLREIEERRENEQRLLSNSQTGVVP